MDTRLDEIADGIYRVSTHLPDVTASGMSVNQFVVLAEEPLVFHTGMRSGFPALVTALRRLMPLPRLRWVSFGHVEADECGAINQLLAVAPYARVAVGDPTLPGSVDDLCDRPPVHLKPGEVVDLGGRRVRQVPTPHAPHNAEAQVLYEETTGTLLCGDLFTQLGRGPAVTGEDLVEAALEAEASQGAASPGPAVPNALRDLAKLAPRTLAAMHGSAYEGDGAAALTALADAWEDRFGKRPEEDAGPAGGGRIASDHG